jgi:3',5'-cyclic-nucleotide phosphodiesterase
LYHNFRHAVDVLQSTFHFLTRIHVLPDYPGTGTISEPRSDVAVILTPFDALTLLVTAIGHDVGHPGVNNGFLVRLNAPLAQLYNDKSVLEAFHCAAFSQILRRHWPAVFEDKQLRALMISSILATDMGVHSQFMEEMAKMRLDYCARRGGGKGYQPEHPESARALLCALLIKCADIGNVVCAALLMETMFC